MEQAAVGGNLVLAATPIGDPEDAPPRLRSMLATADVIAAEDTRRVRRLLAALDVRPAGRLVAYHDAVEGARAPELVAAALAGATVLLVSDAGMPVVSDPGHRLVTAAVEAGVPVTVLPGPSAVTAAVAVSGLPVQRWCFEGFLPRRQGSRRARLAELVDEPRALVFFEAPHRLAATLADLRAAFGDDRPAVACRELSKSFEEVRRGTLHELAGWAERGVRGEVTLVVAGAESRVAEVAPEELAAAVSRRQAAGLSRRDAVSAVAADTGVSRRAVYAAAHRGQPQNRSVHEPPAP